jgi:YD repeat-containing protein
MDIPMAYVSGTTFALMRSYYSQFSSLLPISQREGHAIEQSMIDRSSVLLYPTEWPVKSAINDYHADPSKIHIVPYGANLDAEDVPPESVVLGRQRSDYRCRLLFIGVDWQRKGGPIAFDTLIELRKLGVDAQLTVCGCTPPREFEHERMKVIPFLDKNDPGQRKQLNSLLLSSNFLLVPTRSECFGVVFCEASAFGLPSISTRTGGVPGVVRDGENGYLLPLSAGGSEYAKVIAEIHQDADRSRELSRSSRRAFDTRLNWDAWGRTVRGLLNGRLLPAS